MKCTNCGRVSQDVRGNGQGNDGLYCSSCSRQFQNQNNIRMHYNSRTHRGQETFCPYCNKRFVGESGLGHHLEYGTCPMAGGLDRDELFSMVRENDPYGVITKDPGVGQSSARNQVNESSWNDDLYECHLCRRTFASLASLNQHVNSSIHEPTRYHCPNRQCRAEFRDYSALANHLESESCGFMRYEDVQRAGDSMRGMGSWN